MIGERIKQARLAAGLSLRDLAIAIGVTHTAVSKYEKNENTPSSGGLLALADATGVTVDYFLRPPAADLQQVEYRNHKGFAQSLEQQVLADVADQVSRQLNLYDLLPGTLPVFKAPKLPAKVTSFEEIEAIATKLRDAWKLGYNPIPDLFDTLEEHGIMVLQSGVINANTMSGLSAMAEAVPVIVVSTEWPADRQRFTACHELGHLLMHGRLAPELDEEKACDYFAGAFLVPKPSVISALGTDRHWIDYRELQLLKAEYGLSMNAWLFRAFHCGVISKSKMGQHFGYFKKRGWHELEPGEPLPVEEPRRFPQTVFRAVAENVIGESKAAELLATSRPALQRMQQYVDSA